MRKSFGIFFLGLLVLVVGIACAGPAVLDDGDPDALIPEVTVILLDVDGDGLWGDEDNCEFDPNSDQEDTDYDGLGDECDPDPKDPDTDNDTELDGRDNCPEDPNPGWADADEDGIGDECDDSPDSAEGPLSRHYSGPSCFFKPKNKACMVVI
jgi:hypothetical protein